MQPAPNIRDNGPSLAEAGYLLCAIQPGEKRPLGKAWNEHPLDAEGCRVFTPANAGVGIILGKGEVPVYGLDFDIIGDDAAASEMRAEAIRILGADDPVYRVGLPPKFLIPCRGAAGMRKVKTSTYRKGGQESHFEFLGEGQQFVAEAVHPNTKIPYQWFGTALLGEHLPPASLLPEVRQEQVAELQKAFDGVMRKHGWVAGASASAAVGSDDDLARALTPSYPMGLTLEEAAKYLSDLPGKDEYDTWLAVGMSLHHEFHGTDNAGKAMMLWNSWSQGSKSYRGVDDIAYRWASFGKSSGGAQRTMRWIAKAYNERHYDQAREFSEMGRAYRMLEEYRGGLRYCQDTGAWMRWDGVHWREQCDTDIKSIAGRVLGELLRDDIKQLKDADSQLVAKRFYAASQRAAKVSALVEAATSLSGFWSKASDFDAIPRYLGVANGDIDLKTGYFLTPDPARMTSRCSPIHYDPKATCPLWEQTLYEIMDGDMDKVDYLQRVIGYALMGDPKEELLFIFHGDGSNGKSTVMGVICDILAPFVGILQEETVTSVGSAKSGSAGGTRSDLLELMGKRVVTLPETEANAKLKEATVKRLVSTDIICARGLYAKTVTRFKPTFVAFMLANHMPRIDGTDNGVWRRIRIIKFMRNFENDISLKKDPARKEKLRAEYAGILRWMVEGCLKYQREGLAEPDEFREARERYRADMDIVKQWLEERCELDIDAVTPVSEAWSSWQGFANAEGYSLVLRSTMALTQRLARREITSRLMWHEGKTQRCYIGMRIKGELDG